LGDDIASANAVLRSTGQASALAPYAVALCATVLLAAAATTACGEPADNASPSQPMPIDTLPTPARPAPTWNCGTRCWHEEAVPSQVVDAFDSTVDNVDLQPELVYPLEGSVHPTNLSSLTFQFRRADVTQRWFDIRLSTLSGSSPRSYDFITPCVAPEATGSDSVPADRCVYQVPATCGAASQKIMRAKPCA
jgi:hypothetical protein